MKKTAILIFLFFIFSCSESLVFESENIDFSKLHIQEPVLLSFFTPDTILNITVGATQQAFSENSTPNAPLIKKATIENMGLSLIDTLYPSTVNSNQYVSNITLSEGFAYKIELEFQEITQNNLWAIDTIPGSSKIKSIEITPKAKKVENNLLTLVRLEILPSLLQELSFYEITVNTTITDSIDYMGLPLNPADFADCRYLYSDDPIIAREDYYPSPLQFDAFPPTHLYFKKQHYSTPFNFEFYYSPPSISNTRISTENTKQQYFSHNATIILKTISENYYKYQASRLSQFYSREGDPLYGVGEPVNVFTNINNGDGIFAAYATDSGKINHKGFIITD